MKQVYILVQGRGRGQQDAAKMKESAMEEQKMWPGPVGAKSSEAEQATQKEH